MTGTLRAALAALTMIALPGAAFADNWTLSGDASKLAFGSVKKNKIGEVHHFTGLSGGVNADGAAKIEIDLTSVETLIDIRNERMIDMVFGDATKATLSTQFDMEALEKLAPGETALVDIEGTLALLGTDIPVETTLFVARLGEDRAMVTTDEMIMLSTAEAGIDGGVDALQKVAKLDGITRVSPITLRLVFERGGDGVKVAAAATGAAAAAAAAPAAEAEVASVGGDAAAGKKVFRKCKACHVVNAEKNRVGPHLVGVVGRDVAMVDGFKYSKAMTEWGDGKAWTPENLAAFLAKPKGLIKGTKMAFAGLKKEADVENVIAYLANPE